MKYLIILILLSTLTIAHGEGLQQEVGDYTVELAIEGENQDLTFVAAIEDKQGNKLKGVELFLRISEGDTILAATSHLVTDELGSAHLTHHFEESGTYGIDLTFSADEKVKATFPIEIKAKTNFQIRNLLYLLLAVILGFILGKTKSKAKVSYKSSIITIIIIIAITILHVQALRQNSDLIKQVDIQTIRAVAFQGLAGIEKIETEHLHADWNIFINNEQLDLYKEEYQENNRITHMHEGENNEWVIHVHNKEITLRHYLTTIGIQSEQNCLTIKNATHCTDNQNQLTYLANNEPISPHYLIKDLDKILISYGKEADIENQVQSITNNACIQSNNC
ncbi:MAG: hypothetical protein O2779_03880 [Nanoarchaeota archaeon]|nr:hypothetical protein [Nanoarchaeota archaeon]